jgi:hypothetical protein
MYGGWQLGREWKRRCRTGRGTAVFDGWNGMARWLCRSRSIGIGCIGIGERFSGGPVAPDVGTYNLAASLADRS